MSIEIGTGISLGAGVLISPGNIITPRTPHTVAAMGNAQVSTSQVKFGTGSYTSNSLSGYLKVTPFNDFAFGTSNFTVEFWLYPTSLSVQQSFFGTRPYATNGAYPAMFMYNTGFLGYFTTGGYRITTTTKPTLNSWNSIALVRYGTTLTYYINGVNAGGQWNADTTNYLAASCTFGSDDYFPGGSVIRGYMDEIRVSNIARYTTNYTPATQPFVSDNNTLLLIHCDGTSGSTAFADSTTV